MNFLGSPDDCFASNHDRSSHIQPNGPQIQDKFQTNHQTTQTTPTLESAGGYEVKGDKITVEHSQANNKKSHPVHNYKPQKFAIPSYKEQYLKGKRRFHSVFLFPTITCFIVGSPYKW